MVIVRSIESVFILLGENIDYISIVVGKWIDYVVVDGLWRWYFDCFIFLMK